MSAVFVDPKGPYPARVEEWFDAERDAYSFDLAIPAVYHPPCGPWGQLRGFCTKQDPAAGPWAVRAVLRTGGVLDLLDVIVSAPRHEPEARAQRGAGAVASVARKANR